LGKVIIYRYRANIINTIHGFPMSASNCKQRAALLRNTWREKDDCETI
jgi:hypothetical protein